MISTPTIRQIFESFYRTEGLSRHTLSNHASMIRRWERLTRNVSVVEITTDVLEQYRAECLAHGLQPDSIETGIQTILTMLSVARRRLLIDAVPDPGRRLQKRQYPKWVPTLTDVGKLYEHAEAAKWPRGVDRLRFWRSVICVSLWTGLRCADTFWRFRWDGVRDGSIAIAAQKTRKFHVYPRHPVVDRHLAMVENWWEDRVYQVGRCYKQIHRSFCEMSEAAGVKRITCQPLRRASITTWERARSGAGLLIQGCTLTVAHRHYVDVPQLLRDAAPGFQFPNEMLLPEEIAKRHTDETRMLDNFRRLPPDEQRAVYALCEKLSG